MPLAVLAAGGGYKWIELHDAARKRDMKNVIIQFKMSQLMTPVSMH